ncbi:hypothetical protein W911_08605 [Hyphomicrobium nitrativorans NL23]|uniref:PepSY domain-containing protein n=1 Tax=Hyphomicrobium nitrativorans NL23 TaxID=1029756 RepID=V5SC30_9HYPH|nr:hypothetical protein [Hyphomicrobium nitrativorans]AHB48441.1 hypothetical protein W911_08605 [Hyphomicrobium nitrativorans NL23]
MTAIRSTAALGLLASALLFSSPDSALAADPAVSKDVIAVQLRKQGFECKNPESAEREKHDSKPDEAVWLLTCEGARYKVQLIPKMAAKVERIAEEPTGASQPATPPAEQQP